MTAVPFVPAYPATLYYDGSCQLCAAEMDNLMTRNLEGRLPVVSRVLGLPGIAQLTARAYPVLARNRHLLPLWLITPLFERASRSAAQRAARRASACADGACERPSSSSPGSTS